MAEARRPYRSTLREEQARATRRAIVEAGAALFVERGFAGTTVDAIAERAGVSRKTVFTSVGGKVAVLKDAFDWALAGDDEPVPLGDRPAVRDFLTETDPATAVETPRPPSSTRPRSATGCTAPGRSSGTSARSAASARTCRSSAARRWRRF